MQFKVRKNILWKNKIKLRVYYAFIPTKDLLSSNWRVWRTVHFCAQSSSIHHSFVFCRSHSSSQVVKRSTSFWGSIVQLCQRPTIPPFGAGRAASRLCWDPLSQPNLESSIESEPLLWLMCESYHTYYANNYFSWLEIYFCLQGDVLSNGPFVAALLFSDFSVIKQPSQSFL